MIGQARDEAALTINLPQGWGVKWLSCFTLNAPIATKVVCFSRLLKCLRSLYGKQCGPRSDYSYRSSLFWVHTVCFYTFSSVMLGNYLQQMTFSEPFFFLCTFRVNFQTRQAGAKIVNPDQQQNLGRKMTSKIIQYFL